MARSGLARGRLARQVAGGSLECWCGLERNGTACLQCGAIAPWFSSVVRTDGESTGVLGRFGRCGTAAAGRRARGRADLEQHHKLDFETGRLFADLTPGTWDVVVIGAGAAGLLAAAQAAERSRRVLVLERNTKPGVKILMSGGTRCNLTQATDARGIVDAFGHAGPFLHSALAAFGPERLVDLIEGEGVATKVEPTGKIFPASDRASMCSAPCAAAWIAAERSWYWANRCTIWLDGSRSGSWAIRNAAADHRRRRGRADYGRPIVSGLRHHGGRLRLGEPLGHTVVTPCPALVPLTIRADWAKSLRGITVPDVRIHITSLHATDSPPDLLEGDPPPRRGGCCSPISDSPVPHPWISAASLRHAQTRSLALACDFLPRPAGRGTRAAPA